MSKQNPTKKSKENVKSKKPVEAKKEKKKSKKSDTEYVTSKINSVTDKLNSKVQKLMVLCLAVEALPEKLRNETIRSAASSLDGKSMGAAINAFSQSVTRSLKENPDLMDLTRPAVLDAVEATDFGKLREAVTTLAEMDSQVAMMFLEPVIENPVNLANTVAALPPIANSYIKVLSFALSKVKMPGEILASTLFNLIGAIDKNEISKAINAASKLINDLHRGNYTLGGREPRFRVVFAQAVQELLETLDVQEVGKASVALAEDAEVMVGVLSELFSRDPDLLMKVVQTKVSVSNVLLRSISKTLSDFEKMPDETMAKIGDSISSDLNKAELGEIIKLVIVLFNKFMDQNPDFCILDGVVPAVEGDQLALAMSRAAKMMTKAVYDDPDVKKALEPEQVGEKINTYVKSFNRYMETGSASKQSYLSRLAASIDSAELEKAMKSVVTTITKGLFSSVGTGMAIVRPIISAGWATFTFVLKSAKRKLIG